MSRPPERVRRRSRGASLLELLAGLVLGLIVLAGTVPLLRAVLAALARASGDAETTAAVTAAIDQIVRDLRTAGYDPRERDLDGLPVAEAARVDVAADLDGDGTILSGSEEHVSYRPSASGATLLRVVGAQAMPMLDALAPDGFRLAYHDGSGALLDPAAPGGRDAVRVVVVEVTTRPRGSRPGVRLRGGARLLNR